MSHFEPIALPSAAFVHLTHWKAGSQWFRAVLEDAFGPATAKQEPFGKHFFAQPLSPARVYPCGYLTRKEFQLLSLPPEHRRVLIIRDLRDTLVSGYFSIRYSHGLMGQMEKYRWVLTQCPEEEGLLYLMDVWLPQSAFVQQSWLEADEPFLKFEEFMVHPKLALTRAFHDFWNLNISETRIDQLVAAHAFSKYSGGRMPGEEDRLSHYRKGIPGAWREHFTPKITEAFNSRFKHLLRLAEYADERAR